jgi:hypothetical protein
MIGVDVDAARAIKGNLKRLGDFDALGPDAASLCAKLIETVADPQFPGALVPSIDNSGKIHVLIATSTSTAWRRLSPVLKAFAGPTLTSFDGRPEALPQGDPVANVVAQSQPVSTGVMRLPSDPANRLAALRALVRASDTLDRAPDLQRAAPEPTSWMLARFQDYLNVGRRDAAANVLARLKSELRFDALNIKFLEVQLLAAFGDWTAILDLPGFANLCLARRTPASTALLLEALYWVHLAGPFEAGDAGETRARFDTAVRSLALPMLRVPVPRMLTTAGWRVYGIEAWLAPSRTDIAAALVGHLDALGWIADRVAPVAPPKVASPVAEPATIDNAREALVEVDAVDSVDALASAVRALAKLGPEDLARLREAEPFRSALPVTEEMAVGGPPTSWINWFERAADPSLTSAFEIARHGKDEWPIESGVGDPIVVQEFLSALNKAQSDNLASERTAQALPFLVAWLQRDPNFPRAAMATIYASLLTLFALGSARGSGTYESRQVLVSALLSTGSDAKAYQALIVELAGEGFGVDMVYWMLEIVEDFMRASTPAADTREAFLHSALSRIAPIYARLSSLQRAAVAHLARELGWTLQSFGVTVKPVGTEDFAGRIKDLRIAIYSLTESSSRQAKAAIEELAPSAVADCNADHGGTARLRALAENADLFVITWLSAKHAATDFIREHRGGRPLMYAQGRGFSSILRVIDDHFASTRCLR